MKRFLRGLRTLVLTLLTASLLVISLLFAYLAVTGRAALFGYTLSLIENEETMLVLLQTDMPPVQSDDTILHRSMDGSLQYVTVSHASNAVVYYYDEHETLCSVPLTSPEFAGKLIWQDATLGRILAYVSDEPGRWIVLGVAGGLSLLSLVLLIVSMARRSRALRALEKQQGDELLLETFSPVEIEFEVPEEPTEEGVDSKEPKTYKQETATLDLNELRKRMSEENTNE